MPLSLSPGVSNLLLYALFDDDDDTAVEMTEGTGLKGALYSVSDAAIIASGLAVGTYNIRYLEGSASTPSATDAQWGYETATAWTGTTTALALDVSVTGSLQDTDQEPVPENRRVRLVHTASLGLRGEEPISIRVGSPEETLAVDFTEDLPVNGRIATVNTVAIESGTAGGLTFGTSGRDHADAKIRVLALTAGTYEVSVNVTYIEGGGNEGLIRIVVTE